MPTKMSRRHPARKPRELKKSFLRNMPKATIAKVEGPARGGGSEIALAMDMCFAAVGKAIFGQPEVAIGLVPGALRKDCHGSWGGEVPSRCSWLQ